MNTHAIWQAFFYWAANERFKANTALFSDLARQRRAEGFWYYR